MKILPSLANTFSEHQLYYNTAVMQSNHTLQQKQKYMRENIIDKGYDAEHFVEYCENIYGEVDLSEWDLQKLKNVVQSYLISQSKPNEQPNMEIFSQYQSEKGYEENSKGQTLKGQGNNKNQQIKFEDADWDIFLGGQTSKVDSQMKPKPNQQLQNMVFLGNQQLQTAKMAQKKQTSDGKQPEDKKQEKENYSVSPKQQSEAMINPSTIKLKTMKRKKMPELPPISNIIIPNTEQVAGNFLQKDYTLYHIHFQPVGHQIARKFNDFRKLRLLLTKNYPHIRFPYLQPEAWLVNPSQGTDLQLLASRKYMIIEFLQYAIMFNDELKGSAIIRRFCGFPVTDKNEPIDLSKKELKQLLQNYQNLPKPKLIGQLHLSNNQIVISPTPSGQKYISSTQSLMKQIDGYYEKLRRQLDNLFYYYEAVSKSLKEIGGTFQYLENTIKKFNFQSGLSKEFRVYEGLREMGCRLDSDINSQFILYKTKIRDLFKYERDNMMTLKELFDSRAKIHYEYVRQENPTLVCKSASEVQIDSHIPIHEPARGSKKQLAVQELVWTKWTIEQVQAYFKGLRRKINENLSAIAYQELDSQNDNLNFWNSMIKKCVI